MTVRSRLIVATTLIGSAVTAPTHAQDFALSASPPRFELSAKPGATVRDVVELDNDSAAPAKYTVATADWALSPDGAVTLSSTLTPSSCRPWVAIERREIVLPAKSRMKYRFEVSPPPETAPTECRFAIVISGADEHVTPAKGVAIPVAAQLALIVYVGVGDVKPDISIIQADVVMINGVPTPVLKVRNRGAAHARLGAQLSGTDASGKTRDFTPSTLPILPGEIRTIALIIDQDDAIAALNSSDAPPPARKPDPIAFPLRMSGRISDGVKSFRFDGSFSP